MFLLYPLKNGKFNQNVIHWTITLITHLFGIVHFKTNYKYRLSNHCFINELMLVTYALISNAVEKTDLQPYWGKLGKKEMFLSFQNNTLSTRKMCENPISGGNKNRVPSVQFQNNKLSTRYMCENPILGGNESRVPSVFTEYLKMYCLNFTQMWIIYIPKSWYIKTFTGWIIL